MARSSGSGESKQALTVVLVLFVILSVILGLLAYFGYADAEEQREKALLAGKEKTSMSKQRDANLVKYHMASAVISNDPTALRDLPGEKNQHEETTKAYNEEQKKFKNNWDSASDKPKMSLNDEIKKWKGEYENQKKLAEELKNQNKENKEKFDKEAERLRKAEADINQALMDVKKDVDTRMNEMNNKYQEALAKFEKNMKDRETDAKVIAQQAKDVETLQGQLKLVASENQKKLDKLKEKIPQIDLLGYDQPKGKIVRIDLDGKMAHLNLGSAENVRPKLTFSIFPPETSKLTADRKGTLEVVSVLGDHQCLARITETSQPLRDPIITGDLLFNPSWLPGQHEHVAVAGIIDLMGDGHDAIQEFIRNLEGQGTIIDAYLDLKDLQVKGKGMTRQTSYLILGDFPDVEQGRGAGLKNATDPRQEAKINVNREITKLRDEAIKLGITVVPSRRFLALIGYKLPRITSPAGATTNDLRAGPENFDDKKNIIKQMRPKEPVEMKKDGEIKKNGP